MYEYSLYVLEVSSLWLFQVQHTWYLVPVHANTQQTAESEVRGSVSRVKTPCGQGLPHYVVLQAEQRLPREKAKRSFPMERGSTAKHHPAANPQCSQRFRAEGFPLLCPKPKVMPTSVSVMLEKRGGRCRTDEPIRALSCQMRHTIAAIKATWCRSLC